VFAQRDLPASTALWHRSPGQLQCEFLDQPLDGFICIPVLTLLHEFPDLGQHRIAVGGSCHALYEQGGGCGRLPEVSVVVHISRVPALSVCRTSQPGLSVNALSPSSPLQMIDGEAFLLLTQADIVKIMSVKLGPALKIYNAILMFKNADDTLK